MKEREREVGGWGAAAIFTMLVASQSSFAGTQGGSDKNLRFIVRVHDYAQVEEELLIRAEKEASHILANAGIQIQWLACSPGQSGEPGNPLCERPFSQNELLLNIVPKAMSAKAHFRKTTLGFSPLDDGEGFVAAVFFNKAERLAKECGISRDRILAHAVAHEIGHLPKPKHNGRSLMLTIWGQKNCSLCGAADSTSRQRRPRASVRRSGCALSTTTQPTLQRSQCPGNRLLGAYRIESALLRETRAGRSSWIIRGRPCGRVTSLSDK